MSEELASRGKYVTICFFIFWCVAAFGMGIYLLKIYPFGETSAPLIVQILPLVAPFVMGFIGVVILISILRSQGKATAPTTSYRSETIVYTGDYTSDLESISRERDRGRSYEVPPECPSCGAAISTQVVEWVGPLRAKCPFCNATMEAEQQD